MQAKCRSKVSSAATVEPIVVPPRACASADLGIGAGDTVLETGAQIRCGAGDAKGRQMLDDAGRRDLAGVVAAHAVRNQPEATARHHQVAILVQLPDPARMGDAETVKANTAILHCAHPRR